MKKIFLLFLYLVASSNCIYMTNIGIDGLFVLTPEVNEESYFYIKAENYKSSGKIYLYCEDQHYNFKYNQLEICYTDENPKSDTAVENCKFKLINYSQKVLNSDNRDKYYYSFDYMDKDTSKLIFREYIIVHFKIRKAADGNSIFSVKTSTKDIYEEDKKNNVKKALSLIQIICIIISSILILGAIIGATIFFCRKRKKALEIQGYAAPQPNLAMPNNITYPLSPSIDDNSVNDPNTLIEKPSPVANPV